MSKKTQKVLFFQFPYSLTDDSIIYPYWQNFMEIAFHFYAEASMWWVDVCSLGCAADCRDGFC